jgi:Na+/H+ antiporter NhaC
MVAATPILCPAGHALGADPLMTIGAIIGGAFVGDNLAPISDTTIVSAYSQGTDVPTVVRTRLRYAAVSAVFTLAIYVIIAVLSTPIAAAPAGTLTASPRGLVMLVVPALVMVLILRGRNLVTALLWALVAGIAIGLASGTLTPAALVSIDSKTFTVHGVIVEGIQNMVGMAVFTMFLMALSSTLQAAGLIAWLMLRAERFATTPTRAEVAIVGATLALNGMTGAGTPSMIILGPFVRQLGHKFRIAPWRRGNLLDACSTSLIGFVPYGVSVLIPFAIAAGSLSANGVPVTFTPVDLMPYPFYCWGLMLTTIFAAVSGWGREFMSEAQYDAEARVLAGLAADVP